MSAHTIGIRVGRALGWTGAQVVRRAEGAALATGDFGRGVVDGASSQYAATSADILRARAAKALALADEMSRKVEPAAPAVARKAKVAATS